MKLSVNCIISKVLLVTKICLILGILSFFMTFLYNIYKESQIVQISKEIDVFTIYPENYFTPKANTLYAKRNYIELSKFSNFTERLDFALRVFLYSLIIGLGYKFLVFSIQWSIKTIKQININQKVNNNNNNNNGRIYTNIKIFNFLESNKTTNILLILLLISIWVLISNIHL